MDAYHVYSAALLSEKCLYILHTVLFGIKLSRVRGQSIFLTLKEEIKTVQVGQLFDSEGMAVSQSTWYHRHSKSSDDQVMVINTLGILASILKHRDPEMLAKSQFEGSIDIQF